MMVPGCSAAALSSTDGADVTASQGKGTDPVGDLQGGMHTLEGTIPLGRRTVAEIAILLKKALRLGQIPFWADAVKLAGVPEKQPCRRTPSCRGHRLP